MRLEVETPGETCSSSLHLMCLSSDSLGVEEGEASWNLGGDSRCGRGERWSLESVEAFDDIEENVGTTFFPKGDPESEDSRNRGRNNMRCSTTTPV
jgi:hypothetical protein